MNQRVVFQNLIIEPTDDKYFNWKINFFPKGHSTYVSKIPLIENLKRSAFASKWDRLALATFLIFTSRMRNWGNLVEQTRAVPLTLRAFFLSWSYLIVWG